MADGFAISLPWEQFYYLERNKANCWIRLLRQASALRARAASTPLRRHGGKQDGVGKQEDDERTRGMGSRTREGLGSHGEVSSQTIQLG
jgi:hypothetical protein